jgi:hypothetical protein
MRVSIAYLSHQLFLLEGVEAWADESEFNISTMRFRNRSMLDELALGLPRLLLSDPGVLKFSVGSGRARETCLTSSSIDGVSEINLNGGISVIPIDGHDALFV